MCPWNLDLSRSTNAAATASGPRRWGGGLGNEAHTRPRAQLHSCELNLEGGFLPGQVTGGRARQTATRMLLTPFRETDSGSEGVSISSL